MLQELTEKIQNRTELYWQMSQIFPLNIIKNRLLLSNGGRREDLQFNTLILVDVHMKLILYYLNFFYSSFF